MIDFSSIQNESLRALVMASPAIATLNDVEKQEIIMRLAGAPSEKQNDVIQLLLQEQQDFRALNDRQSEEVKQAYSAVDEAISSIKQAEREYDSAIRNLLESQSSQEDQQRADQLLQQLQNL